MSMSSPPAGTLRSIWIARHGEREDYLDPFWYEKCDPPADPYDSPLSRNGLQQAADLADRLSRESIDHLFASPFIRAIQTAQPIADALNIPIKLERGIGEGLRSKNYLYDPRTWTTIDRQQSCPQITLSHRDVLNPPWPEEAPATCARAARTLQAIVERYEGNLVLIGHGLTVMSMAWRLIGSETELLGGFCSLHRIDQHPDGWRIGLMCERDFLTYQELKARKH